ncbi:MAG: SH3 domain-containing protein [Alphaproteobacteria bacterium]|nr:SH3 domain-containing protein [Alphaproteobacteria bacterium]MBV9371096.1 SH3 domain-containing protein [Alphaproteobacteria bacterium]MBV9901530.1 SH3 domain-containing protein [Alphaproteobacteria bacterium]
MDDSGSPRFDLAKALQPLTMELPVLGPVALDLRTTDFLTWLDEGRRMDRWSNPQTFVQDLLAQRSVTSQEAPPPAPDMLAALDASTLDGIAGLIAERSASSFVPRQVIDKESGQARPRRKSDGDPNQPLPKESHSARLKRIMFAYLDYHRAQTRRLLETAAKTTAATDFLRKSDSLSTILRAQSLASSVFANDPARRAILDLERSSAFRTIQALSTSAVFEQHRRLAVELATLSSPLARLQETARGIAGMQAAHGWAQRDRLFSNVSRWAHAADVQLRLGLSAGVVAALAAQPSASQVAAASVAAQAAAILRPGFETAATLALEGLAPSGAVAELLRRYESEKRDAPVFESVRETLVSLDDEETTGTAFMELFEQAWAAIVRLVGDRPELLRNQAFLGWLSVLISLAGATFTAYQVWGPPPAAIVSRLDAGNDELREINRKLDAERRSAEAQRFIRFVHQVVNLRAEPHRQGQMIRLVYPDQPVRIIELMGEWVYVEVFDYGSDGPVRGWMSRRYLRPAPLGN